MGALHKLAADIYNNLTTIETASGDKRIVWKDTAPESLREWFQDISGPYTDFTIIELDECYRVLNDLAGLIIDSGAETREELEEAIYSAQWHDDYSHDLLMWLDENLARAEDVNDAIASGASDIWDVIRYAQEATRSSMALNFLNSMAKEAER
ncbi:MAG TPA: hypothetical protein VFL85_01580 [Candidatus Saccharimonadales bacterium]|nr:hypothetical protein [Candidatus Saccharimonadales bacterium]